MAKSKFEYVRFFEQDNKCLNNCWIVVRIIARDFDVFADSHHFDKPNDLNGNNLMTKAAVGVLQEFPEINLAFGERDVFSFVLKKNTTVYSRRSEKILSLFTSIFSSSYVFFWKEYFPNKKLLYPPNFVSVMILLPSDENLCDYLSWRQTLVNKKNLHNIYYWVSEQKTIFINEQEEDKFLETSTTDLTKLLANDFNINYDEEPEIFRNGTILVRKRIAKEDGKKQKAIPIILPHHCNINDNFWNTHQEILALKEVPLINELDSNQYFTCEKKL